MKRKTVDLSGVWKMKYFAEGSLNVTCPAELEKSAAACVDAAVPGEAALALSAAGILPSDLYMGLNLEALRPYEKFEWWYGTEFLAPALEPGETASLYFETVDCLADYYLNGEKFAGSKNALVPHSFDVTELLKKGKNTLWVRLGSVINSAWTQPDELYSVFNTYNINGDSVHIRKAPHTFGWDIMPRAITAGIYGKVELQIERPQRITSLFATTDTISDDGAKLCFAVDTDLTQENAKNASVVISGICGGSRFEVEKKLYFRNTKLETVLPSPTLWWPKGYGDPALYDVTAKLVIDGETVDTYKTKIGIRTAKLERTDSTDGVHGKFCFVVNGEPIMCRGTNWVPMDAFHSRDAERLPAALALLDDSGSNMVRCWGGNMYPSDEFYDFCDSHGVLVWQDFAMACHAYPQDDGFCAEIAAEATSVVRRLRNHPSLVLWAGDNECDQLLFDNGTDPGVNRLTRSILPDAVARNDTNRAYLPSSPYFGPEAVREGRSDVASENHLWGPRDYFKSSFYRGAKPHFVSEIGYHGCPNKESLEKFLNPEKVWGYEDNDEWIYHSADQKGNQFRVLLMQKQVRQLFGEVPEDIDSYTFASQVSQAEAKKYFIESIRGAKPIKTGILWWNLLDGWPQTSDAVVDYYYVKKLAYDYIKRSQLPVCLMIGEMENWNLHLKAVNDTLESVNGDYRVLDESRNEICSGSFEVGRNGIREITRIPAMYSDKKLYLIEWHIGGKRFANHYICGEPPLSLADYRRWYGIITEFCK